MKLFLGVDVGEVRAGYEYIDPKLGRDFRNLDLFAEKNECTHIYGPDVLDYIHGSELVHVLEHWVSKLRKGGTISIGGTDLYEISRQIVVGEINFQEANNLMYGQNLSWYLKTGCYSCMIIADSLSKLGLKVMKKNLTGHQFLVEAVR